ncbi:MAG TPA: KH domain-containing protein, partial [Candidatus Dojkabacteria bacterium]|nr:KH domain-containing protein [Candidatus Dojkabacteria bacterium]
SRSKVAVSSNVEGVDPIGSCVGQKGVRINAIMNELKFGNHEEKIDIIAYAEDTSEFIANSLSPAQVIRVTIKDDKKKDALVIVPDEQLSLAIGRDGQNVRLAAKLTSWNIDIQGETVKVNDNQLDEEQRQKLADARRAKMEPAAENEDVKELKDEETEENVEIKELKNEETEENVEIKELKNEETEENGEMEESKEEEAEEKPVKAKKTKKEVKD